MLRNEWEPAAAAFDCIHDYHILKNNQEVKKPKEKIIPNDRNSISKADLSQSNKYLLGVNIQNALVDCCVKLISACG